MNGGKRRGSKKGSKKPQRGSGKEHCNKVDFGWRCNNNADCRKIEEYLIANAMAGITSDDETSRIISKTIQDAMDHNMKLVMNG